MRGPAAKNQINKILNTIVVISFNNTTVVLQNVFDKSKDMIECRVKVICTISTLPLSFYFIYTPNQETISSNIIKRLFICYKHFTVNNA